MEPRLMLYGGADSIPALLVEGEAGPEAMPDFSLVDVNATSSSYNQAVSPRDYLGQVSGWYFTYAT